MKSPVSDKTGRLLLSQTAGHRPSDSFWCHRSRIVYNRMARSNGTRLGPYEILSALGAGGMGEVYLARDPRLRRQVAIKLLPSETAADPRARARLRREAIAIAAIDHPYICKIFEIREPGEALCLVMEYFAGETLDRRLRAGRLPLSETLRVASEIAEALQEAH